MKTLVGIGCSHTAGTAFLKGLSRSKDGSWLGLTGDWASKALAKKYHYGEPTMEWVTNNLTWMAKLNNYLQYDKIVNLGVGGQGLEVNIMNMKLYIDKQEDLSNHIFIHQIPGLSRVNVFHRDTKEWKWTPIKDFIKLRGSSSMKFVDYYFNEDFYTLNNFYEIYYLQKHIENLGGKYYCFSFDGEGPLQSYSREFWDSDKEILSLDRFEKINDIIQQDLIYFEGKLQARKSFRKVVLDINWLSMIKSNNRVFHGKRLYEQGLLKGDGHFTEDGNEVIAKLIWNSIK
jgi:hypothetical protein